MCKVYNQIGSLTTIKLHLHKHNVNEYKSVRELIKFQKNYPVLKEQINSKHKLLIEDEKCNLSNLINQLSYSIKEEKTAIEQRLLLDLQGLMDQLEDLSSVQTNIIQALSNYLKKIAIKRKIKNIKSSFDLKITNSIQHLTSEFDKTSNRHHYIVSCFDDAVMASCLLELQELDRKRIVINQINTSIYGAFGEQKVVKELEKLSDDYILINDFSCEFHPAIYRQQENDYIKSIQIDHILISPSGIFIIETKNWSGHSINDTNLYSPVQQIKRSNFALYKILMGEVFGTKLLVNRHHWGDRKIPIRNLIVFINHKPIEEFQYVKVLSLNEMIGYVDYFKPCFSISETKMIAKYLLNIIEK